MKKAGTQRVLEYLDHIRQAIQRITRYTSGLDQTTFLANEEKQDAVIRNFEIIGEASRNIERHHPDFATAHPDVPWGVAVEMRNALAHGYFKVDMEIVWKTIHHDLPDLEQKISQLLRQLE
ncbi:MAG: HepT-like ribonuclease domain-containing protein [Gammaproteobacteria bacterium]